MRFLMKMPIPTVVENPAIGAPDFNQKMKFLLEEQGAQAIFSRKAADGRLVAYALFDLADPARLLEIAKPVAVWLKIRPEFFPETAGKSYFGDVTLPAPKR